MKRKARTGHSSRTQQRKARKRARPAAGSEDRGEIVGLAEEMTEHQETSPALTGGDVDADWMRAHLSGEEAVGGSVATPDQDVVDEIGHALGVEQGSTSEVRTSGEILQARDRLRWHLEREAADDADKRPAPGRRAKPV